MNAFLPSSELPIIFTRIMFMPDIRNEDEINVTPWKTSHSSPSIVLLSSSGMDCMASSKVTYIIPWATIIKLVFSSLLYDHRPRGVIILIIVKWLQFQRIHRSVWIWKLSNNKYNQLQSNVNLKAAERRLHNLPFSAQELYRDLH